MKKTWIIAVVAGLGLMLAAPAAQATVLAPGTSTVTPPPLTVETGTVIATKTYNYTFGTAKNPSANTGTVQEEVVRSGGTLDFLYQVTVKTGDLKTLAASDFTGWLTDVYQAPSTAGVVGNIMTTGTYPSSSADRTTDGSTVNFEFTPAVPGNNPLPITTFVLIVKTNATNYDAQGNVTLIEGGNGSLGNDWLEPAAAPEPASLILLSGAFAGLAGAAGLRRWRKRVVVA